MRQAAAGDIQRAAVIRRGPHDGQAQRQLASCIARHHLEWDEPDVKQSQNWFLCTIAGGEIGAGNGPEFSRDTKISGRYFVERMPINRLKEIALYPLEVRNLVVEKLSVEKNPRANF